MATSISGNIRLTYGNHNHNETYNTTTDTLTHANQNNDYSAGASRAVYHADVGSPIAAGTVGSEGLLLIKNANTSGKLLVSLDAGASWDVEIPAGVANLISVGPDHAAHVKTGVAQATGVGVASVTTAGVITFDGAIANAGTYTMKATASPDHSSAGPTFIMKTTSDASTTGTVYELNGTTTKDLATGTVYTASTAVTLDYVADYRFTLTEA